jgi:hypothetical protein
MPHHIWRAPPSIDLGGGGGVDGNLARLELAVFGCATAKDTVNF